MGHEVLDTLPFPTTMTAGSGQTYASPDGSGARINPIPAGLMNANNSPFYDNDGTSLSKFRPDLAGGIFAIRDNRNGTLQPKILRAVQLNCYGGTSSGTTAVPGNVALVVQPATVSGQAYAAASSGGQGTALQMGNDSLAATHGRFGAVAMAGGVLNAGTLPAGQNPALGTVGSPTTPTAPTAGFAAKPLYDGYLPGRALLCGDWVYVVEEGPCIVPINSGQTATAGKEAAAHSDGSFRDCGNNETVVGSWSLVNNTNTTSTTGSFVLPPYTGLLMVKRGYQNDKSGTAS